MPTVFCFTFTPKIPQTQYKYPFISLKKNPTNTNATNMLTKPYEHKHKYTKNMNQEPTVPEPNVEQKKPYLALFFKRLNSKNRKGIWKKIGNSGLRLKTKFNIREWFMDRVIFKFLSFFEVVAMVSTLAFFYLCCGGHL